jgi:outer membrane cobalamin receptor
MLEARAVGFQPQRVVVDILDSAEVQTAVSLPVVAPVVDTVKVRADRWSQQQAAFEQRRKMGFGYFLDENAIERRNARYTSDLLRSTPGVSIAPGMNGRDQVLMRGTGGSGQCVPTLFVDGMKTPVTNGVIDDVVRPVDVRAVEVYTGTGSVPLEFQGNSGCGSVVIWTGARRR